MDTTLHDTKLCDAVRENNPMELLTILKKHGLTGHPMKELSSGQIFLYKEVLKAAICQASQGKLSREMSALILSRTGPVTRLVPVLEQVRDRLGLKDIGYNLIPNALRASITSCVYDGQKTISMIMNLNSFAFEQLIMFILSGQVKQLAPGYRLPILRYIRMNQLVEDYELFTYMLNYPDNQKHGSDEAFREVIEQSRRAFAFVNMRASSHPATGKT